jgi:hypothetical protein
VTETQKQPDPNHACHRNGMAHRLERIERDVADIKAALVTKSMPQQPTVSPRADGQSDQTMIRRPVERCGAERQRNEPQQEARR